MKFPFPTGGIRAPSCSISHRFLSTTPRLYRNRVQGKTSKFAKGLTDTKSAFNSRATSVSHGHDPKARLRLGFKQRYAGNHGLFRSTVLHRFQDVLKRFAEREVSLAGVGEDELNRQAALFMDALDQSFQLAEQHITKRDRNPLFWNLRDAFIMKDMKGLTSEIQYSFQSFLIRQRLTKGLEESHKRLLDFRFPYEWFPATRALQRTIHVHVGPTNSGKTYNALKALENSKRGVYAGPLRLLATEVYQRLNAKNIPCALLTGEELRIPEDTDQYFSSCTVEMIPLNRRFDVAVIDEIQMISDPERGNAWTTALLGVQAKEVHVCGEERAVKLLQSICASIGDECVVHRYERLSPLETMTEAVGKDYGNLQKGDAVVAFSRMSLHALKHMIEKRTGRRCAIIYGSLPPEVRVQQAALFNDPNNDYDFVVASDAIGMGLNLEIRRVVMESIAKYDGSQNRMLTHPEIKQIGGRAGRYRSAQSATLDIAKPVGGEVEEKKVGYVTAMDAQDLRGIRKAFDAKVEDLSIAYIRPPVAVIEQFASYFPRDTPLSFILMRIRELATMGEMYQMGIGNDIFEIADAIEDLNLTIYDRLTLCHVPISTRAERAIDVLRALARAIAESTSGDLLSIQEIPLEYLDIQPRDFQGSQQEYLYKLESLHVAINQYIWLSYRYEGTFRDQALAFHIRSLVEQRLIDTLEKMNFTEKDLEFKRRSRRLEATTRRHSRTAYGEGDRDTVEQEKDDPPIDDKPATYWRRAGQAAEAAQASALSRA